MTEYRTKIEEILDKIHSEDLMRRLYNVVKRFADTFMG